MGMTMSESESFVWAKRPGGKVHLVVSSKPTVPIVNDAGAVEQHLSPLCGRAIDVETHRFKGFDKHRGLDFCKQCKRIYLDRDVFPTDD